MKKFFLLPFLLINLLVQAQNICVFEQVGSDTTITDTINVSQLYSDFGNGADNIADTLVKYINKAGSTAKGMIVVTINSYADNLFADYFAFQFSGHTADELKMMSLLSSNDEVQQDAFTLKLKTEKLIDDNEYDVSTWVADQETVSAFDIYRKETYTGTIIAEGTLNGVRYAIVQGGNRTHFCDYYTIRLE